MDKNKRMIKASIDVSCARRFASSGMYSAINVGNISFVGFFPSYMKVEVESFYPCCILLVQG
jgi:hypothetical protein